MIDKQYILEEIKRTAALNGGTPLGCDRFERETGIKYYDWFGRFWSRWNDALTEAGYAPNKMQGAYEEAFILGKLVVLMRDLGRFPTQGDIMMRSRTDDEFPSAKTFRRLGSKEQLVAKVLAFSSDQRGCDNVIAICNKIAPARLRPDVRPVAKLEIGFVYLIRAGRYYKIGRSNAPGRRERELAIQLPDKSRTVHVIRTDDPTGIEAYWHKRFENKRKNGEWFELTVADISSFTRRKFM